MSARSEYPGTIVPDMMKDPIRYGMWWGKMVYWAFKWGPYLLETEKQYESYEETRKERGGEI